VCRYRQAQAIAVQRYEPTLTERRRAQTPHPLSVPGQEHRARVVERTFQLHLYGEELLLFDVRGPDSERSPSELVSLTDRREGPK